MAPDTYVSSGLDARFSALGRLAGEVAAAARSAFEAHPRGTFEIRAPHEYRTAADLALEARIRDFIAGAFPDDTILSEEAGGAISDQLWVIDPIDGTANFARGQAHFAASIAYAARGRCELAAVIQPVSGEIWLARRGEGAMLNGTPIAANGGAISETAAIELGWSARLAASGYLAAQGRLLQAGAAIRRGGSAALALAHVADGRSDGYICAETPVWECLAGRLIVAEAGGQVGPWPRSLADFSARGAVMAAANGEIAGLVSGALELLTIVEIPVDDR